ncbi:MAG: hypothetical protein ACI8WB_000699 [Phenylobacterium sp.]|jgi:hypothetical protein
MSITQELAAAATAANSLTQKVTDKITVIDQRVDQFNTDATNTVATVTEQLRRANIGVFQQPFDTVTPGPEDDAGVLVNEAYANGAKHVRVAWPADGLDRHWNTLVSMPVGTTLQVAGPHSSVAARGGSVRSDRACYVSGHQGGTSALGSPMIFRNLTAASLLHPFNDYLKVWDEVSLIVMSGNNTIHWGDEGTYVHDQGGMTAHAYGNGLVSVQNESFNMPNAVLGGGVYCQFYISAPFINNRAGTATCEVRMQYASFSRLSSDGPILTADKGYRRLMDKGVPGVTPDLLNKQPYEVTAEQAALNDNVHAGVSYGWYVTGRGIDTEANFPRVIGTTTWAHKTGWTMTQLNANLYQVSKHGMVLLEGTDIYMSVT